MIILPTPSQDEIDRRFELAVSLHKEHLLSKTGKMYPFNPDNLQEAIAEMSEDKRLAFAARAEIANTNKLFIDREAQLGEYICRISKEYWDKCAQEEAFDVVQTNFDPSNMR